jgi:hypothetical protein
MQRAVPLMIILLVLGVAGYLLAARKPKNNAAPSAAAQPTASATSNSVEAVAASASADPEPDVTPPSQSELDKLLGGGPVPPLPKDAPQQVDIAVILFTHEEAELAGKRARSKKEALRLAQELIPQARENFTEAVKRGDPGSTDDAGTVPRGVLEPALQYVVYTLEKGQVFPEPVDTPRGYWVVKRTR